MNKSLLRRVLRDPLLHFLMPGVALFAVFDALNPTAELDDPNVIVVDRQALLSFVQYRSQTFDAEAAAMLDGLDAAALDQLIADYVQEEALFREGLALGPVEADYIVRKCLCRA